MADFPNQNDLFRIERDEILIRNSRLSRESVEREGTDVNILLAASAAAADEVVGQLTDVCAGNFLDAASGQSLDRLVFDRYGLTRKPAAPSLGSVEFSTTVNNPSAFTIPAGAIVQTTDGIQFQVTSSTTFPSGTTGPIIVPVRSILAGIGQQAAIGTITNIVSPIVGQPTDLAVNNSLARKSVV